MKANRRKFLGLFGGAVAAGPAVVRDTAGFIPEHMAINGIGVIPDAGEAVAFSGDGLSKGWAKDALKKFLARTPEEIARIKRNTNVYSLPPDVYALRSVSIGTKIRMAREVTFRKNEEDRKGYLDGVLKGWWG
jgi:hypothetical protein